LICPLLVSLAPAISGAGQCAALEADAASEVLTASRHFRRRTMRCTATPGSWFRFAGIQICHLDAVADGDGDKPEN